MNTKKNILLTGGRAPVTLDLARKFKNSGHTVYIAESIKFHLCKYSTAVNEYFFVPSARVNENSYIDSLIQIIKTKNISLLIPTCEEIFYISRGLKKLSQFTEVFADSIDKLDRLHNKFKFNKLLENNVISVAETFQLVSINAYHTLIDSGQVNYSHVLKPVYSRFSSQTQFVTAPTDIDIDVSAQRPWVVQKYIPGRLICTYSICYKGEIFAHLAYVNRYNAGDKGAGICFERIEHQKLLNWISSFVKKINHTGQIGFDLIEANDGSLWPIECNPRATSGIHLFSMESNLPDVFISHTKIPDNQCAKNRGMLGLAMIMYLPKNVKSFTQFKDWISCLISSIDVIFCWNDPLPFLSQILSLIHFLKISRKNHIRLVEATTHDIEWNGN